MKKIIENAMAKNLMYTNFGIREKFLGVQLPEASL